MFRPNIRSRQLGRSFHSSRWSFADVKEPSGKAASSAVSNASATANKATATAQEYASKALEQSQKFAQSIGNVSGRLLENAGPRVNGIVSRLAALQKPIVYWSQVTGEVAKQVYLKEKMSPPSSAQFQETFNAVWKQVSKPDVLFRQAMQYTNLAKLAEVGWQPIVRGGLRGFELFGFFVIGEMIGRRSIKGYQV